jgi:hypothetical protein
MLLLLQAGDHPWYLGGIRFDPTANRFERRSDDGAPRIAFLIDVLVLHLVLYDSEP